MAEAVNERGAEHLVLEHLFPSGEGEVGGDDGGLLAGPEGEVVEEHLGALLVEADIPELVADDQVVALEPDFHASERFFCPCLPDEGEQVRDGGEEDGVPLDAGLDAEPCGDMRFARSGVAVHDDAAALLDEVEGLHFGQQRTGLGGQFLSVQLLEVLHLREAGHTDAGGLAPLAFGRGFQLQQAS